MRLDYFLLIIGLLLGVSTNLAVFYKLGLNELFSPLIKIIAIIFSSFCGGLFAGLSSYHFESKKRIEDKRFDKYFEHRNTIIQIEHEFIPIRVNLSRNLASITDALENISESHIRLVLRLNLLQFSQGLNLKLLNIELINKYAEMYSLIETINSDIDYLNNIVKEIRSKIGKETITPDMLDTYVTMLAFLKDECLLVDKKSLILLSSCREIIRIDDKDIKKTYIRSGGQIIYSILDSNLKTTAQQIKNEEELPIRDGEPRPRFLALYLDLKKE